MPINIKNIIVCFSIRRKLNLSSEKKLTQYLIQNYDIVGRCGRPVEDYNQTTLVEFGLGLIQIDLDESEKVLTTSMWTRMVRETALCYAIQIGYFSNNVVSKSFILYLSTIYKYDIYTFTLYIHL